MERLGIGPDDRFELNPRLVYGRMTGWGQEGPLAYCRFGASQGKPGNCHWRNNTATNCNAPGVIPP